VKDIQKTFKNLHLFILFSKRSDIQK